MKSNSRCLLLKRVLLATIVTLGVLLGGGEVSGDEHQLLVTLLSPTSGETLVGNATIDLHIVR